MDTRIPLSISNMSKRELQQLLITIQNEEEFNPVSVETITAPYEYIFNAMLKTVHVAEIKIAGNISVCKDCSQNCFDSTYNNF